MKKLLIIFFFTLLAFLFFQDCSAQLIITQQSNAQALVQQLVGQGVSISNVSVTGSPLATGFFNNISGTNIGLDSGIVLSNGRVKTVGATWGMDGNGIVQAYTKPVLGSDSSATGAFANSNLNQPGDADLSVILGGVQTYDATVLEFNFVPLGDTIRFRYVFSSEEYPTYPCQGVNDGFAFLINGPGYSGLTNIALIPGTNAPVTIDNINYNPGCGVYPQFYLSNRTNTNFTYNGHTTIFTAIAVVQPCQQYHLKLVIGDVTDHNYDSGVFLEAKSLSSNVVSLNSSTQIDQQNHNYLVEGCMTGTLKIKRPVAEPSPLNVSLSYGGTAINGVDIQALPASVIIPANQTEVTLNLVPIVDNLPEGIEELRIYAIGGCTATPTDSAIIQIRDYDTLGIQPDTAFICKNNSIQLVATPGQITYQWDPDPTLSNTSIHNPVASPVNHSTTYYCTSVTGNCHGRDSSFIVMKDLELVSKTDINCKNDNTGEIKVAAGPEWTHPVAFSINNGPWQPDSTFSNLPFGVYRIRIKDAAGCLDSMDVTLTHVPDLLFAGIPITAATCTGNPDGTATVNMTGGTPPYLYSLDGINYQTAPVFNLLQGNYTIYVKDQNNCPALQTISIPLFNHIVLDAGSDQTICEGTSVTLACSSNADTYSWTPATGLDNNTLKNPVASPVTTTLYKVTAYSGICSRTDSATVFVNPAPHPDAGNNVTICYGQDVQLQGSGGTSFYWYPSSFLNDIHAASPVAHQLSGSVWYYLHVRDALGCYSLKRDSVYITVSRPAAVFAGRDTVLAIGQPLQLFATDVNHTGFTSFVWAPAYGLDDAFLQAPRLFAEKDITYTVTARNPVGCMATGEVKIKVYKGPDIYVPNAFTPNRDGLNDILKAIPVGISDFHYFRIYDRWGKQVFISTNPANGWDGRISGNELISGTYIWVAEGTDYTGRLVQRRGSVIIVR
ncbi:MAG: choice-of-anchor L domain-containing protein [Ferruginibacter sp.]